jgi:hypothetical protein
MTVVMSLGALLLLALQLPSSSSSSSTMLQPRCGNLCWCVPMGGVDAGTCPDSTTAGVRQDFPLEWAVTLQSFRLKQSSTIPTLNLMQSSFPGDSAARCYPFADAVGDDIIEAGLLYAAAKFPQCMRSVSSPDAVCAYQYYSAQQDTTSTTDDTTEPTCMNREYEMKTYGSKQEATLNNAVVIHKGACGVCSSAQDLSVRMALPIDSLCSVTEYVIR